MHPQRAEHRGHVNPIGKRACYDEGKRCGEAFAAAFREQQGVDARLVRIFNTYGPRMQRGRRPRGAELHPAGAARGAD